MRLCVCIFSIVNACMEVYVFCEFTRKTKGVDLVDLGIRIRKSLLSGPYDPLAPAWLNNSPVEENGYINDIQIQTREY